MRHASDSAASIPPHSWQTARPAVTYSFHITVIAPRDRINDGFSGYASQRNHCVRVGGTVPAVHELHAVAERIWADSASELSAFTWVTLSIALPQRLVALRAAHLALSGDANPERPIPANRRATNDSAFGVPAEAYDDRAGRNDRSHWGMPRKRPG